MDTLEGPSVGFFLSRLWHRFELGGLDTVLVGHAEIKLILFEEPSWSIFTGFVLVNGEHGEPADFLPGSDLSGLSVPVQPLAISILQSVMHVLLLVWVLNQRKLLRVLVSVGLGQSLTSLSQHCGVNLLIV